MVTGVYWAFLSLRGIYSFLIICYLLWTIIALCSLPFEKACFLDRKKFFDGSTYSRRFVEGLKWGFTAGLPMVTTDPADNKFVWNLDRLSFLPFAVPCGLEINTFSGILGLKLGYLNSSIIWY